MTLIVPPDSTDFVVVASDPKTAHALQRQLDDLGRVEPLRGHPGMFIITPRGERIGAAERLRAALKLFGSKVRVSPLLEDERGNRLVPTGKVTVRFKSEPSDADLQQLAAPLGLTIDSRNKYIPSQVSFRVAGDVSDELLDVVDRIRERDDRVLQAWPETLGLYRRA
jgi:hypothetical protein